MSNWINKYLDGSPRVMSRSQSAKKVKNVPTARGSQTITIEENEFMPRTKRLMTPGRYDSLTVVENKSDCLGRN